MTVVDCSASARRSGRSSGARRVKHAAALVLLAVFVAFAAGAGAPAGAAPRADGRPRVVLVVAPGLTWDQLQDDRGAATSELLDHGAMAAVSTRTATDHTDATDAALSIGAGNRVHADRPVLVQEDGRIADFGAVVTANRDSQYRAAVGALGDALAAGGLRSAVIETDPAARLDPALRTAALVTARSDGTVPQLHIARSVQDARDAVVARLEDSDLVVVGVEPHSPAAVESALATVRETVDLRRDHVVLVAPSPPHPDSLTVFAMAGGTSAGVAGGWADSGTTRRAGFVTLSDFASTILGQLNQPVRQPLADTAISARTTHLNTTARLRSLIRDGAEARVRDAAFGPIATGVVTLVVVGLALSMAALRRCGLAPWARAVTTWTLAVPTVGFLSGFLNTSNASTPLLVVGIFGAAAVLASGVRLVVRRRPDNVPLVLIALIWLVICVDLVTGGHLQLNTPFGYSPLIAGRFAGAGNQAFSLIAMSGLALAAAGADRTRWSRRRALCCGAVVLLVTLVVDGAPWWGSDVGGVLALAPVTVVTLAMLTGIRIRWQLLAAAAGSAVVVLGGFAGWDMRRPSAEQTHLGRTAVDLLHGRLGPVLERKLATNLAVYSNWWSWFLLAGMVVFAYLAVRPGPRLREQRRNYPSSAIFAPTAVLLAVLGMLMNDSGISIPALMMVVALSWQGHQAVAAHCGKGDPCEPSPPS
jgi:hypothetical protein